MFVVGESTGGAEGVLVDLNLLPLGGLLRDLPSGGLELISAFIWSTVLGAFTLVVLLLTSGFLTTSSIASLTFWFIVFEFFISLFICLSSSGVAPLALLPA